MKEEGERRGRVRSEREKVEGGGGRQFDVSKRERETRLKMDEEEG